MLRRRLLLLHRAIEARTARVHGREQHSDWIPLARNMRNSASLRRIAGGCLLAGICAFGATMPAQQRSPATRPPAKAAHPPAKESQLTAIESRLPPTVQTYIHWRGTKTLDTVKAKNGLLRLWSDPDFAPIRRAIIARALGKTRAEEENGSISPDQLAALLPLFENEAILGSVSAHDAEAQAKSAPNDFLIYDATGKGDLLGEASALPRKASGSAAKSGSYILGGIKIETSEGPRETNFSAQAGNYYLRASRKDVIEDLVSRFSAKASGPSLADDAVWKRARQNFPPDAVVELFSRFSTNSLDVLGRHPGFSTSTFAKEIHLERFNAAAGSLSFSAEATRVRFAILGDTSDGSLFDIAGASTPNFATLALARDGASYSAGRADLMAIYRILRGPLLDALPPKENSSLKGFEALGGAFLGMPLPDAVGLLGGEVASISSAPGDPTFTDLFAVSIRKREDVLNLLRKAIGPMIRREIVSGDATILELETSSKDPATNAPRAKHYYVAVTPQLLIFAQRKGLVDDAVARLHGAPETRAESLSGNPEFRRARALLPASLSGLSYTQMNKQTWEREFSVLLRGMASATGTNGTNPAKGAVTAQQDWLQGVNLGVFSRYLHSYTSGWWKASDGIYFDSYLQ